jgi:hypothetical protein
MPTAVSTLSPVSPTALILPGIACGAEAAWLRWARDFQDAPRAHFQIKEFL